MATVRWMDCKYERWDVFCVCFKGQKHGLGWVGGTGGYVSGVLPCKRVDENKGKAINGHKHVSGVRKHGIESVCRVHRSCVSGNWSPCCACCKCVHTHTRMYTHVHPPYWSPPYILRVKPPYGPP
jgi:hypothetical protein